MTPYLSLQSGSNGTSPTSNAGSHDDSTATVAIVLSLLFIGCVLAIAVFICKARRRSNGSNDENLLCFCIKPQDCEETCDPCITFCDEYCCYFCSIRSYINSTDRIRYLMSSSSSSYSYSRASDDRIEYMRADLNSPYDNSNSINRRSSNSSGNSNNHSPGNIASDSRRSAPASKFTIDDDIWDESIEIGVIMPQINSSTPMKTSKNANYAYSDNSNSSNNSNSNSNSFSSKSDLNNRKPVIIGSGDALSDNKTGSKSVRDADDTVNALHSI